MILTETQLVALENEVIALTEKLRSVQGTTRDVSRDFRGTAWANLKACGVMCARVADRLQKERP